VANVGYLDCFSGISGDMLLAALIDAGLPLAQLKADLARLRLPPVRLSASRVQRAGLAARLLTVAPRRPFARQPNFAQIVRRVKDSRLPAPVVDRALACLTSLRDAEHAVHGPGLPDAFRGVELIDTLVDIVGASAGLERLGLTRLSVSTINVGRGLIQPHAHGAGAHDHTHHHGPLPVPSPAAVTLLTGFTIHSRGPAAELTTPTGAALVSVLARSNSSFPPMRLTGVAHGAGHRRLDPWPNLLRLFIGEELDAPAFTGPSPAIEETLVQLDTALDDYPPQWFDHLRNRLMADGALDVYLTPTIMKQGRSATHVTVLTPPERAPALMAALFDETPTLGIRAQPIRRWVLPRRMATLAAPGGAVGIKLVRTTRGVEARPEYRDVRAIAERTGRPLRAVMREIDALARRRFERAAAARTAKSRRKKR